MKEIKARYRNKLKKIIIEVFNGEKWVYVKTLSDPLIEFREECLKKLGKECLEPMRENEENQDKSFALYLLNEPTELANNLKKAKEAQNKLMGEILDGKH